MASQRAIPFMVAAGVGVIGGVYIWNQPLQELSGKGGPKGDIKDGRSQTVKDGKDTPTPMRHGGAQHNDLTPSNVAGTTPDATKSNSVDHSAKTQSSKPALDGSGGGGVGVAEMRERKMKGQGGPSPQGGDTKPQAVESTLHNGEGGGVQKKGKWWLGGW